MLTTCRDFGENEQPRGQSGPRLTRRVAKLAAKIMRGLSTRTSSFMPAKPLAVKPPSASLLEPRLFQPWLTSRSFSFFAPGKKIFLREKLFLFASFSSSFTSRRVSRNVPAIYARETAIELNRDRARNRSSNWISDE